MGADLELVVLKHLNLMVEIASINPIISHIFDTWSNCPFYIDEGTQLLVLLDAVERLNEICRVVSKEANLCSLKVEHHGFVPPVAHFLVV